MKKLVFIDACMRAGSRTKRIARPIIAELIKKYSVETVDLTKNIYPVADNYTLEDRNQGIVPPEHVALAKKIAATDPEKCISICPKGARGVDLTLLATISERISPHLGGRKDNHLFL